MPKKLNSSSNERIDLLDFNRAASDFTDESLSFIKSRILRDTKSRVLNGFRVVVEDQTATPGQITIYNGDAIDTSGHQLHNEDQENASVSITLTGASQTFYVEVTYTETPSDSDYRAFWDPTKNNTLPTPEGGEIPINVATRLSPNWSVVTPVSTTGFSVTTNPSSTNVPICILRTDASNVISNVQNANLVQVSYASVLEYDVATSATKIKLTDSRLFGDTGNIIVDSGSGIPQTVAITANDRVNNILTINPGLTNAHSAGAIVVSTGSTGRFVRETTDPNDATFSNSTPNHSVDQSKRFFQGDETRGIPYFSSKETYGGRDDLNIRVLKDYVDFLSAQIREMKFGSPRSSTTSFAPPSSFRTTPRYYDSAGGITGARNASVSVGNGTTTFGDFNGTTDVALQAAINAAPDGGTVYVKPGAYTANTTITINKNLIIVGDGIASTSITSAVSLPNYAFSVAAGKDVSFDKISLLGSNAVVSGNDAATIRFYKSKCAGFNSNATVSTSNITVDAVSTAFTGVITATSSGRIISGSFANCTFTGGGLFTACTLQNVEFTGCKIESPTSTYFIDFGSGSNSINVNSCNIKHTSAATYPFFRTNSTTRVSLNISNSSLDPQLDATSGEMVAIIDALSDNTAVHLANNSINCTASNTSGSNQVFLFRYGNGGAVAGCAFSLVGGSATGTFNQRVTVLKNNLSTITARFSGCSTNTYGVIRDITTGATYLLDGCAFSSTTNPATTSTIGIDYINSVCSSALAQLVTITITGCRFFGVSTTGAGVTQKGLTTQDAIVGLSNSVFTGFTSTQANSVSPVNCQAAQTGVFPAYSIEENTFVNLDHVANVIVASGFSTGSVKIGSNKISNISAITNVINYVGKNAEVTNNQIDAISGTGAIVVFTANTTGKVNFNTVSNVSSSGGSVTIAQVPTNDFEFIGNRIKTITSNDTSIVVYLTSSNTNIICSNNEIDSIEGFNEATVFKAAGSSVTRAKFDSNIISNIGSTTITCQARVCALLTPLTNISFCNNQVNIAPNRPSGDSSVFVNTTSTSQNVLICDNNIVVGTAAAFQAVSKLIFLNNLFSSAISNNTITVGSNVDTIFAVSEFSNVQINNNTVVSGTNGATGTTNYGVYMVAAGVATGAVVTGNRMSIYSNGGPTGIYIVPTALVLNLNVSGNAITFGDGVTAASAIQGIVVSTTLAATGINVNNNTLFTDGSATTSLQAIQVLGASSSVRNTIVSVDDNNIRFFTSAGSPTTILGIVVSNVNFAKINNNSVKINDGASYVEIRLTGLYVIYDGNIVGTVAESNAGQIDVTGLGGTGTAGTNKTT